MRVKTGGSWSEPDEGRRIDRGDVAFPLGGRPHGEHHTKGHVPVEADRVNGHSRRSWGRQGPHQ